MAFSFNNNDGGFASTTTNAGASAQKGDDLGEILTEQLGFQPICGDSKLQLLPGPWPPDALPQPSASLLAVGSSKGLVAAAGPSELIVTSTTSVRNAWVSGPNPENNVKAFNPEVKVTVPRLSHLAFSADENVLVVATEGSGGLAAYKTETLVGGKGEPSLHISTNNQPLRALAPNPNLQSTELFAVVTRNGELLVADLNAGQLRNGPNGPVLKGSVSCVSWSNQGKQLVAGLGDGTVVQMTPDGAPKAEIPRPPSLEGDKHVSTLSWLSNDTFLIVYSLTSNNDDMPQPSDYFFVSRQPKTQDYTFQALPEVCPAFGLNRSPACQFVARLRGFEPHIDDLLLIASTTSIELGMVTKADAPLSGERITDSYTLTMPADDSRRAQLPLSLTEGDTSPIGLALDLSAQDSIVTPLPSDPEIEQSPGPLPNILALNHEGVLSSWWIVYADSIREKKTYSGLIAARASKQSPYQNATGTTAQSAPPPPSGFTQPTFGQSEFGKSGFATQQGFAKPAVSTFAPGSDAKFGGPSLLSGDKPSWTTTGFSGTSSQTSSTGFGQPAFGTSTPIGGLKPAFGAPTPFGGKPAFGQPATPTTTPGPGTAFNQADGPGARNQNPFAGAGAVSPFGGSAGEGKGFAAFSNKEGFSVLAANRSGQESPFGKGLTKGPAFSQPEQPSPFAPKAGGAENKSASAGFGSNGFSIRSTFKGDEAPKGDVSKTESAGGLSFGGDLGDALEETTTVQNAQSKEEEMDEGGAEPVSTSQPKDEPAPVPPDSKPQESAITPPSTISQPKNTPAPPLAGLFSTETQPGTTPAAVQNSKPGWSYQPMSTTTPKETPKTTPFRFPATLNEVGQSPKIKTESPPGCSSSDLQNIPEAPLPPDPTSKARYIPGDTTDGSDESKISNEDVGLPSDLVSKEDDGAPGSVQTGPPDDEDDDLSSHFDGSVEDATQDISPIDEPSGDQSEQIQTSPESSFGKGAEGSGETSPAGGLFTKISTSKSSRLFGEVITAPILPPPVPQESPRSPSPVRHILPAKLLRPETSRSVSAPTRPHSASALDRRRAELVKSALASGPVNASDVRDAGHKDMGRSAAAGMAKPKQEADTPLSLEDDEDARLRAELEAPPTPSEHLETFVPHRHSTIDSSNKSGIPGQIERLYQDINSMIDTLGINARSLSAYILYQTSQDYHKNWPQALNSKTPRSVLSDEWVLQDIFQLQEGEHVLGALLESSGVDDACGKFKECEELLDRDVTQLRMKLTSTRKALHASLDARGRTCAPLSAEQASLQHDLRKASMSVQSKLVEAEQELTVLRAKLAEARPSQQNGVALGSGPSKKPTVEAVIRTIAKMTSMAEKRSTDVDVLEAQLKKLGLNSHGSLGASRHGSVGPDGTPQRRASGPGMSLIGRTPLRGAGTVYHTPDSTSCESTRGTPVTWLRTLRDSVDGRGCIVSDEDSQRWREKARRKKEIDGLLAEALAERRKTGRRSRA